MQYFFQDNHSHDLIAFFSGWGCDQNQFTNLHDSKDVLIIYDYQNLTLDFNFSGYENIYVIAYSAGVFVASILVDTLPNIRQKTAVCGNPYLFDDTLGMSKEKVNVCQEITLDNYMEFRKKYMVFNDEELERYNNFESLRTIESCKKELTALQKFYNAYKSRINPFFDKAVVAENDLIFDVQAQKDFYKDKLKVIKQARHHIFFHFNSFEEILKF